MLWSVFQDCVRVSGYWLAVAANLPEGDAEANPRFNPG
jgi:hypothetical protein